MQNPENQFETAILHMGVNDLLKWDSNIKDVTNSVINIGNEFLTYGIKSMFVSGFIINNRLYSEFISTMNNGLKLDCVKYGYNFIGNSNILPDNLWEDGLFLNNSGY